MRLLGAFVSEDMPVTTGTEERYWTNPSVLAFAGGRDPIEAITERARALVLEAMDEGWSGPPFDPFALADRIGVAVVARTELADARTVSSDGTHLRIEFNPTRPHGRLRFSVAHELAHTFFPDAAEATRYRSLAEDEHLPLRRADDWQLELLCNIAAAELLMPVGTFESLADEPPDINHLMHLRKRYEVSTEALFRRLVRVTERPVSFFAASRIDGNRLDAAFRVDYFEASHRWRPEIRRGELLPPDTILRHCTAVGYTEVGVEQWGAQNTNLRVQCAGVSPYPGARFPRVVGLLQPVDESESTASAIRYVDGDATHPRSPGNRVIAHVVNDRTPNWGGAFARALRQQYPDTQEAFRQWVAAHRPNLSLGQVHVLDMKDGLTVATMVAQQGYGASVRSRLNYSSLHRCLYTVGRVAEERAASVHMPRIGAGMAGGNWAIVRELIDDALVSHGVAVTVYTLPGAEFASDREPSQLSF